MKRLSIIVTLVIFLLGTANLFAQNSFPTAKNSTVVIDGGTLTFARPVTTGGWARGISFFNSDMSERTLALGMFGSGTEAQRFYIAYGDSSPWSSLNGLHILPNGWVGIGTISPQARLAVNGNILAKEIKVKADISVPDYVFEPDYKMLSLSEVENYVKTHKHLPEIPSAKEIGEEGLDLAAMNLLLLKKVEELTLHLIEKEKKEKAQDARLAEIENLLIKLISNQ